MREEQKGWRVERRGDSERREEPRPIGQLVRAVVLDLDEAIRFGRVKLREP